MSARAAGYRALLPMIGVAGLLAGCAGGGWARQDDAGAVPEPTCEANDCEALMARARRWLVDHTSFPIMTESDRYIATERDAIPTSQKIWGTLERKRLDDTHSRLVLHFRCNNPVRCREDVLALRDRAYADLAKPSP